MLFRSLGFRPPRGRSGRVAVRRRCRQGLSRSAGVVAMAGAVEPLEDRTLLSVGFVFDYSYDTADFFGDPARQAVLEQAAADLGHRLYDRLDDLTVSGSNTWSANFIDPGTGDTVSETDLVVPSDTLYVFAGGRELDLGDVGRGGYGGFSASGDPDWLERVNARGQAGALLPGPTDFGPWGGSVTFDTLANWHFGSTSTGLDPGEIDFYSVAIHELGHLLGIAGSNPSWTRWIAEGEFEGTASVVEFDGLGSVPLDVDEGHWGEGVTDNGQEAAMDPSLNNGARKEFTELDFAGLVDLGWALLPVSQTIDLADGFDHTIVIEDNQAASDFRFRVTVDGTANNLLVPSDVLVINGADGADVFTFVGLDAEFAARIEINAQDGDDVVSAQVGFDWGYLVRGGNGNDSLVGGEGDDTLEGESGSDVLSGGEGDDELMGGAGADRLAGGPGADLLDGGDGDGDTLLADSGDDTLDGGAGTDLIEAAGDVDFTLTDVSLVGLGNDVLTGVEEVRITAGASANLLDATLFSGQATLIGAGGEDTLRGGSGADVLIGNAGKDTLEGGGGDDRLLGGRDADRLDGGVGNDFLKGQGGSHDSLIGGSGDDTLDGGPGNDWVIADGGVDWVLGATVLTGDGPDVLFSIERGELTGDDLANRIDASGFGGNVTIYGGGGDDTLLGGSGIDLLNGNAGNDSLVAGDGDDRVFGGGGNDWLDGGGGDDRIRGHGGNFDTLVGGPGDDQLNGGSGSGDRVYQSHDGNLVLVDGELRAVGTDRLASIDIVELVGGAGDDFFNAAAYSGDVILRGGGGNDTLLGGAGADLLVGNSGDDLLDGAAGADRIFGGSGADQLFGGAGNDLLRGQAGDGDRLTGGDGNDTMRGGPGSDVVIETGDLDFVLTSTSLVGRGNDLLLEIEGVELTGGAGDNSIDATTAVVPVTLIGAAGNDTLRGGAGDDHLEGLAGDDLLDGGGGVDRVVGEADVDWTLTDVALEGDGADTLVSIEAAVLTGGDGANLLDATDFSGNVTLVGGKGNDTLRGGSGNDRLDGGAGDDRIAGHAGSDRANGGSGNDVLLGGAGNDTLLGGSGADSILGGDGDDTLKGQGGIDRLCGGDGTDLVVGTAAEIDSCIGDCFDDICMDV